MFANLKRKGKSILPFFALAVILIALGSLSNQNSPVRSVEIAINEQSPVGLEGGLVVPASCNSYEHTPGECSGGCTPSTQTETLSCPAGQSGSITRARSSWCPGPTWTEWFESSTCTTDPIPPIYSQGSYPPTYSQSSYGSTDPTITGTPNPIDPGGTVTITWSDPEGRSCAGIGFSTGGASSGSVQVTPADTTNYGVQCGSDQVTVTIVVTNPVLTIGATPARVRSGSASSISWSATNVTSCTLTGTGVSTSCSGAACASAHNNSTGALSAQTVYTLACQTGVGGRSATATVFITPTVCEVGTAGCPDQ